MFRSGAILALSQAIVLFAIPVVARLYTIDAFALFASFLVFYALGTSVATLRLADAIVKEAAKFLPEMMSALALLSALISACFALLYFVIFTPDIIVAWLLCAAIFLFSISRLYYFSLIRDERFMAGALVLGGLNVLTVFGQIAFSGYDLGLIYGLVFAVFLLTILQIISMRVQFGAMTFKGIGAVVSRNRSYAIYLTAYSLIGVLKARVVYLFLGLHPLAGVLTQFEKLANAPNTFLSAVIRPIVFRKFEPEDICSGAPRILAGLSFLLFALFVPFTILLYHHHQLVVRLVLGAQWESYSSYFFLIFCAYSVFAAFNWYDRIYDILRSQKLSFLLEAALTVISVAGYWWFSSNRLMEEMIFFYAYIVLISSVLTALVIYGAFAKKLQVALLLFAAQASAVISGFMIWFFVSRMIENALLQSLVFLLICYGLIIIVAFRMQVTKWLLKNL